MDSLSTRRCGFDLGFLAVMLSLRDTVLFHWKTVLYVEYSTGSAFDSPTQNTINKVVSMPSLSFARMHLSSKVA